MQLHRSGAMALQHCDTVAAPVLAVRGMEGLVNITNEMEEELECEQTLCCVCARIPKLFLKLLNFLDYTAFWWTVTGRRASRRNMGRTCLGKITGISTFDF